MQDLFSLAYRANDALSRYIAVHDDLFGSSPWQTFRRSLPIPGLFRAIPYAAHTDTLVTLHVELQGLLNEANLHSKAAAGRNASTAFLTELGHYCQALDDTVLCLSDICRRLANKAEGGSGPSWSDYKSQLNDYEQLREIYTCAGERLNDALRRIRREA